MAVHGLAIPVGRTAAAAGEREEAAAGEREGGDRARRPNQGHFCKYSDRGY
jgi:hypothetical protein